MLTLTHAHTEVYAKAQATTSTTGSEWCSDTAATALAVHRDTYPRGTPAVETALAASVDAATPREATVVATMRAGGR